MADDGDAGGGMSRRGLLGLFGRGVRGFTDAISEEGAAAEEDAPTPEPYPVGDRILRPLAMNVEAETEGPGVWRLQLSDLDLPQGGSLRVYGVDMHEAVVLVRESEWHLSACSSECPVDGSDLIWAPREDLLLCPGCGSRWRLDGSVLLGPANSDVARYVVDRQDDRLLIFQP